MSRNANGERAYCAVGAIQEAAAQIYPRADFFLRHGVEKAAVTAVANVYHGGSPTLQYDVAVKRVTDWNDWDSTTWHALTKRFRAAKQQVLTAKS